MEKMTFREEEIAFLVELVRRRSGIVLDPGADYLLDSRLSPLMEQQSIAGPAELVRRLRAPAGEGLASKVVERMVTHETRFFRDVAPFDALARRILPALAAAEADRGPTIRIWSAACATGQEAYSLAIAAAEAAPRLGGSRVEILATDLSGAAIARAREGLFSQLEVNRGLAPERIARHFAREGRHWRASQELRERITFSVHNLVLDAPPRFRFDVVFCRNVLIYLGLEERARVLTLLHDRLAPGGYLVLGAAEAPDAIADRVRRASEEPGACCFQRIDGDLPGALAA